MATMITLENLQEYTNRAKTEFGGVTRDVYSIHLTTTGQYTTTIPNYASTNYVDVYFNGFLLNPAGGANAEYTLTSAGVFTSVNTLNTGGHLVIVCWRT